MRFRAILLWHGFCSRQLSYSFTDHNLIFYIIFQCDRCMSEIWFYHLRLSFLSHFSSVKQFYSIVQFNDTELHTPILSNLIVQF